MNTNALAKELGLTAHALHAAVCRKGSYFGIRPSKLPNGRLIWPTDSVERLLSRAALAGKEAAHVAS